MAARRLKCDWSAVDSWKNRTRQDLRLSRIYMEKVGITRDERLFAIVFGYFDHIAEKIIDNESNVMEKIRLSQFFKRDLICDVDGFGLYFQEVSK